MISFPNAKINLGLYITSKRDDGFHNIATIFYPIPLFDVLEINESNSDQFFSTGLPIPGGSSDNLVLQALELLREKYSIPSLKIHLHKNIPMGAGLGGGSSDASFMLKMLNSKFELGITNQALIEYAAQIGSDCAFFINSVASIGTARGENLRKLELDLEKFYLLIVNPGIHIKTAEAYADVLPTNDHPDLIEQISRPLVDWNLSNQFEKSVFLRHPQIMSLKNEIVEQGAVFSSMSGSGSSVFGLFEKPIAKEYLEDLSQRLNFNHYVLTL